ncbi:hypothetical protein B0H19DRAFT_1269120 [Mycena capillaripes]|nr:hypothetical protein B0H19DRAFT_1269120 [Mycena capillaripes]
MHPAVRLENLQRLTGPVRFPFSRYFSSTSTQRGSLQELESLSPITRDSVACAVTSLSAIFQIILPDKIGSTLWTRVWPWTYFLYEHWDYLPPECLMPEIGFYVQFLVFLASIYGPPAISATISETPGLRVVLGKIWGLLSQVKPKPGQIWEGCFRYLADFISTLDFEDPVRFAELVYGVGGSLDQLASLVITFVQDLRRQTSWENRSHGYYFRSIVSFIQGTGKGPIHAKFLGTLLRHIFVPEFVSSMSSFLGCDEFDTEWAFKSSFEFLTSLLNSPSGRRWLPDAIGAGLLRTMATCTTKFKPELHKYLRPFLTQILPRGLVYYDVVVAVEDALDDIGEILYSEKFQASELLGDWDAFFILAEKRISLKHDLAHSVPTRACDNLECGKIHEREHFRRCSRCKAFYYCSPECQLVDWSRGEHRKECNPHTVLSLAESGSCVLSFRQRQFLRVLVNDDYHEQRASIYKHQIPFLAQHSLDGPIFTLFDYTSFPLKVSVHTGAESPIADALGDLGPEWMHIISRAANSGGRIQLHVIRVPEGNNSRFWVVPLRTNNTQSYHALHCLAKGLPANCNEKDILDGVKSIIEEYAEEVKIH